MSIDEYVIKEAKAICAPYSSGLEFLTIPKEKSRFELQCALSLSRQPSIQWRVKKALPQQGVAAIYGPPGSAKSFLALDLAMAISNGTEWFGKRTTKCPVVYVCLEGEGGLPQRLKAIESKHSLEADVSFMTSALDLLSPVDLVGFRNALKSEVPHLGVLIIDTLNRSAPTMDENSSVDMGHAIKALKLLQVEFDCLIVLVHHTGKDAGRGLRGHSSLLAALDAAIEVKRTGTNRAWTIAKSKDGNDGESFAFQLEQVITGLDRDGDMASSCIVRTAERILQTARPLTVSQQFGLDSFARARSVGMEKNESHVEVHLEQWRAAFYETSTADSLSAKRKAFNRARKELVELGKLIVQDDTYSYPITTALQTGHGTEMGHVRDMSEINHTRKRDERDTPL